MKDWKQSERRIARILGGELVPVTGRQRGSAPDVKHPRLAIEVKSRAAYPEWLEGTMRQAEASALFDEIPGKMPVAVLHRDGKRYADDLVLIRLSSFAEMFTDNSGSSGASERRENA